MHLQNIVHVLDECMILGKGTVWRGITDIYITLSRVIHYTREVYTSKIPTCYLGKVLYMCTKCTAPRDLAINRLHIIQVKDDSMCYLGNVNVSDGSMSFRLEICKLG